METKELPLPRARANDIVIREMPDEVLVYDLKTHKAHCLNQTAAMVWKYCNGQRTVAEIVGLIAQEQHKTVDEAAVWLAVERLSKVDLLEERVASPAGSPRLGRREAMRRLGLGSAIAVPLVMSIVAPTVQAACTNLGTPGMSCSPNSNDSSACCSRCCKSGTCQDLLPTGTSCASPSPNGTNDAKCCSGSCSPNGPSGACT